MNFATVVSFPRLRLQRYYKFPLPAKYFLNFFSRFFQTFLQLPVTHRFAQEKNFHFLCCKTYFFSIRLNWTINSTQILTDFCIARAGFPAHFSAKHRKPPTHTANPSTRRDEFTPARDQIPPPEVQISPSKSPKITIKGQKTPHHMRKITTIPPPKAEKLPNSEAKLQTSRLPQSKKWPRNCAQPFFYFIYKQQLI